LLLLVIVVARPLLYLEQAVLSEPIFLRVQRVELEPHLLLKLICPLSVVGLLGLDRLRLEVVLLFLDPLILILQLLELLHLVLYRSLELLLE